ncbi:OmpA/MotB family protein [Ferruginibacter albus]|uniref:OmpA/MotB family protein n=1 Tax=Ferruginibacter albus TaxID=2875540 RepID=UPI001CC3E7E8|nr:flagellar motor protein MotB [Ferruginibacter albus]UAY53332.1 flagellar motor protein MotB [Ferruginibacter albus]
MKKQLFILFTAIALISQSCVSKRLFRDSQSQVAALRNDSTQLANKIEEMNTKITALNGDVSSMNKKIADLNNEKNALDQQTTSQQNALNQTTQTLQQQRQRLQQLEQLLEQQRKQSRELKDKMSEALNNFKSNELTITQKNGKVYVSLSEELLFPSGSAVVNPRGVDALAKLAAVLNLNPDISVDIEGHTDSIPIKGRYQDNWDLSTARANSIVRILVNNYKVDPVRVIASGHSKYDPVDVNFTPQGRANNRRTEIILSPKLDEMYKLLES